MVWIRGAYGGRKAGEEDFQGRNAMKETSEKTQDKMERCAPKRPGGEWTEVQGSCCGSPRP